jgi:hypothetical protein
MSKKVEHENVKLVSILAKAATDEDFLHTLNKNPEKVLRDSGIDTAQVNLAIVEDLDKLKAAVQAIKDLSIIIFKRR